MNLQRCRVVLRPRNPLDCMDLTLVLIRDQARPILGTLALVVLPIWVLMSVGAVWSSGHWFWLALALVVGPVLQLPFVVLGGRLFFSSGASLWDVVKDVMQCWTGLVAWALIEIFCVFISMFFCFVLLPFLQALFLFVGEAILLERVSVQRSVRRSLRLAGRHYGIALAGAFGRWVIVVWMALCLEATGQFLMDQLFQMGTPLGSLMNGEVSPYLLFGVLIAHPFFALYRLILYMDVRTRTEGWDLQVALRALALAGDGR